MDRMLTGLASNPVCRKWELGKEMLVLLNPGLFLEQQGRGNREGKVGAGEEKVKENKSALLLLETQGD